MISRVERIDPIGEVFDAGDIPDDVEDCPWCGADFDDEGCSAKCIGSRRVDKMDEK